MNILFVGDIMPGGVLPYQNSYIDQDLLKYMGQFDLRIGTLESAIGTNIPFDPIKMSKTQGIVFSRNEDMKRVKELNINVVTLANNHIGDLGLPGIENTLNICDKYGIPHTGAGMNKTEAKRSVIIEQDGNKIAILGCMVDCDRPIIFHKATDNEPGIYQVPIDELLCEVQILKKQCDKLIVMPHWCEEHEYLPPAYYKDYAKRIIDAGADLIIGSHPHIINPVVSFNNKKCFFSLGNFLFPEKCMQVPRPMYYPETAEECHSLKRMWTYPKSISEPIVAVWKPKNRIGMMVEMEIGEKIKTSFRLTCLTADNVLHHYDSKIIRLRMHFWAFLVKMPKYGFVRRLYNHRYNLIRRIVDKLPAFNIPVEL